MTTKLEQAARQIIVDWDSGIHLHEAITALLEALAEQAEQEPVKVTGAMVYAFHHALTDGPIGACEFDEIKLGLEAAFVNITIPIEPVKQEPVAWWDGDPKNTLGISKTKELPDWQPLYAAPIRTKDLTDEEATAAAYKGFDEYWTEDCKGIEAEAWLASARAVIAADREKNQVKNDCGGAHHHRYAGSFGG